MLSSEIFVITHKKIDIKLPSNYKPIQVGNNKRIEDYYLTDNTQDNISKKNANYCELTGIYWVWKNYKLPDYIGIAHYRRYFKIGNKLINLKQIDNIMKKYDVILPKKFYFNMNVWDNYFKNGEGKEKDLITLSEIINSNYPEYIKDFNEVMSKKYGYYCNMFIIDKNRYCEYCDWLFSILEQVEKETDLTNYTKQEARIYGYLSEILLNVWVNHKALKIKECRMVKVDDTLKQKICFQLHMIKNRIIGLLCKDI